MTAPQTDAIIGALMERLRTSLLIILIVALSAALYWLWFADAGTDRRHAAEPLRRDLTGIVLPQPRALPDFLLHDYAGRPITADWFKGKWTFAFFGYTHCPDICPTTLYTMQQVSRQLERTPDVLADTRFLFVTLDPQRDTAEILKGYVQHFDQTFLAARGDSATIDRLSAALNIPYAIEREAGSDEYVVNHAAAILLIDSDGRYHARYTPTQSVAVISDTYREIRNRHR
jgi:protein SCO1/2